MTDSIVDGTKINTEVFSYSPPKAHASGGKVVNLFNKHFRESLTLSTPLMLTWGAQEGMNDKKEPNGKWTMSLQFPSSEYTNPDAEAFLTSMRAVQQKVKQDAITHSKEWFGKEIKSAEVIEEKFNVMLRHPKKSKGSIEIDETRPPTLTVKIPQWSGVWKPEIYDEDGEPLYINGKVNTHLSPLEFLKPKTHVICLLQCGGLWFVNGKISITWNLKQAIVQKPKQTMEGTCFLKPKASDKALMKTLPPPEEDVDPDGSSATIVADSDDEEEDQTAHYKNVEKVVVEEVQQVVVQVVEEVKVEEVHQVVEEVKAKKKIVRKKAVE
jgi:hypothetical protein